MKLIWHPDAVRELDGIVEYVRLNYASAPLAPGRRVSEVVSWIEQFPEMGPKGIQEGTREMLVGGLPFVIVYKLTSTAIIVLHVVHTAQHRG